MKVDEARIESQVTSGLVIGDVIGLMWVNECIKDICYSVNEAGKRRKQTVVVNDTSIDYTIEYPLIKLEKVIYLDKNTLIAGNNDYYTFNFDNTITFREKGTYEIEYMSPPNYPTNVNDQIPLPDEFLKCLKFYLAYKIRSRQFGLADADAVTYYQSYQAEKMESDIQRQKKKVKKQIPSMLGRTRRW